MSHFCHLLQISPPLYTPHYAKTLITSKNIISQQQKQLQQQAAFFQTQLDHQRQQFETVIGYLHTLLENQALPGSSTSGSTRPQIPPLLPPPTPSSPPHHPASTHHHPASPLPFSLSALPHSHTPFNPASALTFYTTHSENQHPSTTLSSTSHLIPSSTGNQNTHNSSLHTPVTSSVVSTTVSHINSQPHPDCSPQLSRREDELHPSNHLTTT